MADKADGSVVLAQLQVAFLWEFDNFTCSILKNVFKEKYLSDMKCHFTTSEMTFLLIMSRKCMSK